MTGLEGESHAPGVILCVLDATHRVVHLNARAARTLGREPSAAVGVDFVEAFVCAPERPRLRDVLRQLAEGAEGLELVFSLQGAGGMSDVRQMGATVTPLQGLERIVLCAHELPPRRAGPWSDWAGQALREGQARLRAITDSAQDAIITMDPQGRVSLWNPAAEKTLGYRSDEVLGQDLHELLAPARFLDVYRAAFLEFARTGTGAAVGKTVELAARRKDGREIAVSLSLSAVSLQGEWHAVGILRDDTERKKAEQKLRESEEQYRLLTEHAVTAIAVHQIVLDDAGKPVDFIFLSANPAFTTYTGLREADIVGRRATQVLPGIEQTAFVETCGKVALTGEPISFEQHAAPLGRHYNVHAYRVSEGQFATVFTDITDRKRAEHALEESEAKYRHLVENSHDILYTLSIDGRFTFVSPGWEHLLGHAIDDVMGKPCQPFIHPEDVDRCMAFLRLVLEHGSGEGVEYRVRHADGSYRYHRSTGRAILDASGRVIGVQGNAHDITEQKRAQIARDAQVRRLRALSEFALDSAGLGATFVKRRAVGALAEAFDVVFCGCVQLTHAWPGILVLATRSSTGEGRAHPVRLETLDRLAAQAEPSILVADAVLASELALALGVESSPLGPIAWVPLADGDVLLAILSSGVEAAAVVECGSFLALLASHVDRAVESAELRDRLRDHGERLVRRVAERTAELSRANDALARASRLKDDFLAAMSHELRTPLNAVLGLSESLLEQVYGALTSRQARIIGQVQTSGHHLLALINDILDVAKIGAGKLDLSLDVVSPAAVAMEAADLVRTEAAKKHIAMVVMVPASLPAFPADALRLKQILVNLLSNAVKFTPPGGNVAFAAHFADEVVCFEVTDTGIGIAPEDLPRLFTPFVQLDAGLSRAHGGTGLGLSLVRSLAELHGGGVEVQSERGRGSRFSVRLPVEAGDAPRPTLESALQSVARTHPKVLLADAHDRSFQRVTEYLVVHGFEVTRAQDGFEALVLAAARQPDLILMDVHVPRLDGLAATRELRMRGSAAPVIAIATITMVGDRERCLAAGANAYMTKPVCLSALGAVIMGLLAPGSVR